MTQLCTPDLLRLSQQFLRLLLLPALLTGCVALGLRPAVSPAEKTFRVSGYVLDSVNRKPVAGVFVHAADNGLSVEHPRTDAQGHFVRRLPLRFLQENRPLVAQTVLYRGRAALAADTSQEITILLQRTARRLPPDACAGLADSLRMRPYASQPTLLLPGGRLALFVANPSPHAPKTIRGLLLHNDHLKLYSGPYWLRIYAATVSMPERAARVGHDEDNLMEGGVGLELSAEGRLSQYFDLTAYAITVPAAGLFIELESIVSAGKCILLRPIRDHVPTGPLLAPPCTLTESRNWFMEFPIGWHRMTPVENPVPFYHSGLQVELMGKK